MSSFVLDIRGQLNNIRLAESKALWPLFEAVVNSIQAIEDSPNKNNGRIHISAQREISYNEKATGIVRRIEECVIIGQTA